MLSDYLVSSHTKIMSSVEKYYSNWGFNNQLRFFLKKLLQHKKTK